MLSFVVITAVPLLFADNKTAYESGSHNQHNANNSIQIIITVEIL